MRVFFSILSVMIAVALIWFIARDLLPPSSARFAAGPPEGGYARIARQYREILAEDGIDLIILDSEGSVENARMLDDGRADIALLQGGIPTVPESEAIAAIFYEPLFVFVRADADIPANPGEWGNLSIAIGSEGSGTRAAAETFFAAADLGPEDVFRDPRGGSAAATALLGGDIDVALFVAPLTAPYLEPLFASPQTRLLALRHTPAISHSLPQSRVATLNAGSISLSPTVPPRDIDLIVMVARLSARDTLHPALVDRLVEAARRIHYGRDALTELNKFPSSEGLPAPADIYARDLLNNGTSTLQQYLPYWVTAQINRVLILLLPLLFLLIPLFRILPGLYRWRMRSRVWRHYSEIRRIDAQARQDADRKDLETLDEKLEALDWELANLDLPLAFRDYAYTARLHIDMIRKRIRDKLVGMIT
ncbi:TAXI family TRAP transporter solute-binding subunit [Algicella marina]|uniref:C4-dicarboxylate ABC transporter substrate-binding protein n=1 Tax=Algicella marina TaxID=2683284 RepID=A0A6P1SXQ3_9RHOB|nr:TAXI family TRAP transporter solute-binding subunit [Algicella marina]QHQ34537.1 hypothetical protein GO499_04695 [Algicella marina]